MLQGRFATKQSEARYPTLWSGLVAAFCPSVTGPTGLRLLNFGRGGDGTLTNMDAPTDWVRSQGQYCLDFDGTDDYVSSDGVAANKSTIGTVSFWFCGTLDSVQAPIAIQDNATAANRWGIVIGNGVTGLVTNELIIVSRTASGSTQFGRAYATATRTELFDGNWHLITTTSNGTSTNIYLDGKLKSTTNYTGTDNGLLGFGTAGILTIGTRYVSGSINSPTQGKIDDIRIYNRSLSASEIALLSRRRGIAFEPIPRHRRLISRIVDPQPTAAAESTGFVFDRRLKLFKGQYAVTKQAAAFPNLWEGCVAAYAPCITGATGLKLFDFARGNTGTLTNMDSASDWPRSQGRHCLDFDGTNDYVALASVLNPTTNFTVSMWVNPSNLTSIMCFLGVTNTIASTGTGWGIRLRGDQVGDYFEYYHHGVGGGSVASSSAMVANTWQHIAAVKRGTSITVYLNGRSDGTGTISTTTPETTNKPFIGARSASDTIQHFVTGQIDDIAIYNRALSAAEIRILSRSRGIAYTPKQKQYREPHNFAAVAATMSRLLMLRRKAAYV